MASSGAPPSANSPEGERAAEGDLHSFRRQFQAFRERVWHAFVTVLVSIFFHDRETASKSRIYTAARRNKTEVKRFFKFAIVGFSGLVVDFTVLNILAHILHVDSAIAIAIAFIVAATNNFIWNIVWVYPESRASVWRQFPTFLVVNAVGLAINELILFLFESPMERLVGSPIIGLNLTKAIAAVIVMMWNFFVNRFVTFRHVKWGRSSAMLPDEQNEQEQIESAL